MWLVRLANKNVILIRIRKHNRKCEILETLGCLRVEEEGRGADLDRCLIRETDMNNLVDASVEGKLPGLVVVAVVGIVAAIIAAAAIFGGRPDVQVWLIKLDKARDGWRRFFSSLLEEEINGC